MNVISSYLTSTINFHISNTTKYIQNASILELHLKIREHINKLSNHEIILINYSYLIHFAVNI